VVRAEKADGSGTWGKVKVTVSFKRPSKKGI
jgi:hypothetical protein